MKSFRHIKIFRQKLPWSQRLPQIQQQHRHGHSMQMSFLKPSIANRISSLPPDLPFMTHDLSCREFRTRFPHYSNNASALYDMIRTQALYPPSYFVQLHGTHTETRRNGNKETKDKIQDFLVVVNLTHLLGGLGSGEVELLPDNKRGYRGTRFPSLKPTVSDSSDGEEGADSCEDGASAMWQTNRAGSPSRSNARS